MHKSSQSRNDNYYEAIIQIRPRKNFVLNYIKDSAPRDLNMISKTIDKKFGYDLYIVDRKFATKVSRNIKKRFNCEIKVSKALHSQDRMTSKLLYRLTVLIRLK